MEDHPADDECANAIGEIAVSVGYEATDRGCRSLNRGGRSRGDDRREAVEREGRRSVRRAPT
jgi:hypothetical protein